MQKCVHCNSDKLVKIDDYRCLAKEDEPFFGEMSIFRCEECMIALASPLPSNDSLSEYYEKVYRKSGRSHHVKSPEKIDFTPWSNAQYAYIAQFTDFDNIKTVLDIGPGYGFLLREIRRKHPHLRLIAVDPDVRSLEYLKNYEIETISILFEKEGHEYFSNEKIDLIITSHSLEHSANINEFFKVAIGTLSEGGGIFLEVPNCEFNEVGYLPRAYDSPHLLFFTIEAIKNICKKYQLNIVNITTAGMLMNREIELMKNYSKSVREPSANLFRKSLQALKSALPQRIKNTLKSFLNGSGIPIELSHYQYGGNRWTIRSFFKNI